MKHEIKIGERNGMQGRAVRASREDRIITFMASTDAIDRHGTRVDPMGIDTANFERNSIVGWAHGLYSGWMGTPDMENVIGKSAGLRKSSKGLEIDIDFMSGDINPRAEMAFGMVKGGFLNAVSIGFIPREVVIDLQSDNEVPRITKCELLEVSVVALPSNPEALALARAMANAGDVDEALRGLQGSITPGIEKVLAEGSRDFRERMMRFLQDTARSAITGQSTPPAHAADLGVVAQAIREASDQAEAVRELSRFIRNFPETLNAQRT